MTGPRPISPHRSAKTPSLAAILLLELACGSSRPGAAGNGGTGGAAGAARRGGRKLHHPTPSGEQTVSLEGQWTFTPVERGAHHDRRARRRVAGAGLPRHVGALRAHVDRAGAGSAPGDADRARRGESRGGAGDRRQPDRDEYDVVHAVGLRRHGGGDAGRGPCADHRRQGPRRVSATRPIASWSRTRLAGRRTFRRGSSGRRRCASCPSSTSPMRSCAPTWPAMPSASTSRSPTVAPRPRRAPSRSCCRARAARRCRIRRCLRRR